MFFPDNNVLLLKSKIIWTSLSAAQAGVLKLFSSNGAVRLQRGHDTADQLHILQSDVRTL